MPIQKSEQEAVKRNIEKWTPTLIEAGWTAVPSIILEKQHALGLDAIDVNILLHLWRHWWYRDNPPYPSKRSIAKCMGIDQSTVRRRIARMEKDGLIRRKAHFNARLGGQETNRYFFDGLINAVTPHAVEFLSMREKQRMEDEERRSRKKPRSVQAEDPSSPLANAPALVQ